ncbi:hypothetical protein [Wenyingzhuangia sp. 2_MG-2023]|uniref:hypothetical protein n=1 Tax=Wenyingzhuangia sp. 2_MG-2023 TaxID=3062639 RepID=UPI0026E3F344|nr:hypothetical protein [Wenyingzhuangia sp. 2_MG-2023]MDO6739119.1 hypothetical protein [Wenyingzhuangia sp. 2_MG-2023]
MNLSSEIFNTINIVIGAGCALIGAYFQTRFNDKNKKKYLLSEKLERTYSLCQDIYDGHKREISNIENNLPENTNKFLENRKHPGKETSELKMLIKSYHPEINYLLKDLNKSHSILKKNALTIEEKIRVYKTISDEELIVLNNELNEEIINLGKTLNIIKDKISNSLHKLI